MTERFHGSGRLITCLLVVISLGSGYGGLGVAATFAEFAGLERALVDHDTAWGGRGLFNIRPPLWSVGGHGAAETGSLTIGGFGTVSFLSYQAESTGTELMAAQTAFEIGYPYAMFEVLQLGPSLGIGPVAWCHLIHSQEPGRSNYFRWHLGWVLSAAPGVELSVKLRVAEASYVAVYLKGAYSFSITPVDWHGDPGPPEFRPVGFQVQSGLRFGRMSIRPFRM